MAREGDKVICTTGDIDRHQHAGEEGVVTGFARFSKYHPREVYVTFAGEARGGWFWESSAQPVNA